MTTPRDGGPAFHAITCRVGDNYNPPTLTYHRGMSLRDWFAGQVLHGLVANAAILGGVDDFAERSYMFADAMLKARGND